MDVALNSPVSLGSSELPDFMEMGLDPETRFRRLKEHYIALKEEQARPLRANGLLVEYKIR